MPFIKDSIKDLVENYCKSASSENDTLDTLSFLEKLFVSSMTDEQVNELNKICSCYKIKTVQLPKKTKTVVAPQEGWSDQAIIVAADKYLTKIPYQSFVRSKWEIEEKHFEENSIYDLVWRVCAKICKSLSNSLERYILSVKDHKDTITKLAKSFLLHYCRFLYYSLITQSFAFNSPVWFNVGYEFYPIKEYLLSSNKLKKDVDYVVATDENGKTISVILIPTIEVMQHVLAPTLELSTSIFVNNLWQNSPTHTLEGKTYNFHNNSTPSCPVKYPQISACYIVGVDDTIESIFNAVSVSAKIFRFGSGVGMDWSKLRAENYALSNGGLASGPISFMKVVDTTGGVMRSGGRTRRSAIMFTLSIDHPDVKKFIKMKSDEEKKAKILASYGNYSYGIDGEAQKSVFFQNVNVSVRLTEKFMSEVLEGKKEAKEMLRFIAENIHNCGDPGIQFSDIINSWRTCLDDEIVSSNPCSEYLWFNNTSCNLASINLMKVKNNFELLEKIVWAAIISMDTLISLGGFPSWEICEGTWKYRTLGLGFANLGAVLMSSGIEYGSKQAQEFASVISSIITSNAYMASAILSKIFGPAPKFDKSQMLIVLKRHKNEFIEKYGEETNKDVIEMWDTAYKVVDIFGARNCQVTCIAPTGTIGLFMDCETTGIEPYFSLICTKYLVGGGHLRLVADSVIQYLRNNYEEFKDLTKLEDCISIKDKIPESARNLFKTAIPNPICEKPISPQEHIDMMAAVQPFISMGISKTINLPNDSTIEDIENTIIYSYKNKLKCVAIYRDGSKLFQPLQAESSEKENIKTEEKSTELVKISSYTKQKNSSFVKTKPRKMPVVREGYIRKFTVGGISGYLIVGLHPDDKQPGEIFINISKEGSTLGGLLSAFGILFSLALQYGVPIESICKKLSYLRFEPYGITNDKELPLVTSIIDYIVRRLEIDFVKNKQHSIPHIEKNLNEETNSYSSGRICTECGEILVQTGYCHTCPKCGFSIGCG